MKYALCIGINDYPGVENDLSGCVNDAYDWMGILKQSGYSIYNVLTNQSATKENILKCIRILVEKAKSGDSIFVQFSGHGTFVPDEDGDEPDGVDECWCPHDIMLNGPIIDDEIFDLASKKENGVKFILLSDSCHSGTIMRFASFIPLQKPNPFIRKARFIPPATFLPIKALSRLPSHRYNFKQNHNTKLLLNAAFYPNQKPMLLIAGCQDIEYSYDAWFNNKANGAFSYFAMKKLREVKPKTYGEWFDSIRSVLPCSQYPQTPNMIGPDDGKDWDIFS
jgi:hypothetical protein